MDPFTQRMLERARARQEKIDQKLANSGQAVPKRKPLVENIIKNQSSPAKSPIRSSRDSILSPKKSFKEVNHDTPIIKNVIQKSDQTIVATPQKPRNDIVVTKKEFKSPKHSISRRNSDVSVEINISHRNDIQIEVQVEERDAPISIVYDSSAGRENNVVIKEIEEETPHIEKKAIEMADEKTEKTALRHNFKSRLDRLGNLYSDKPDLSSPIHRTEQEFTSATPPLVKEDPKPRGGGKKYGRLAALADQINNWEDDLSHHTYQPQPEGKKTHASKDEKLNASTLDVSIHSFKDINKVLQTAAKPNKSNTVNTKTFKKPTNECQRLEKNIVAELEGEGYRRVSATQSRLVYEFAPTKHEYDRQGPKNATTPSAASALNMATMVASSPIAVSKKPSIKKYKAPTPPSKSDLDENCESEKDKENNVVEREENDNTGSDCIQTKQVEAPATHGSPAVRRLAPRLNGNVDRSSVLSKAAMFEAGSPRSKEKDPAEMSLRERKALFEKNKGAAIVPKAPFGLAPSAKTLHGETKDKTVKQTQKTPTKSNTPDKSSRSNSKDSLAEDNVSQSSVGGGIKGKLAALFNKEQTISETTIANKFKMEREREMEMLQNRFHYKPQSQKPGNNDSDDDQSEHESEKAPLMGSTLSLSQTNKKPEIIANVPKVTAKVEAKVEREIEHEKVVGAQPVKRRSSQDSPVVLSVLEDVKRIKVNNKKENGAVVQQPGNLCPHLSDIETDNSNNQEEYSDCGGSRCGHYTLECIFFFLCI